MAEHKIIFEFLIHPQTRPTRHGATENKNKKMKSKDQKQISTARFAAAALLLPTLASLTLVACRHAGDDLPDHSLVVGVDVLTDDPSLTEPETEPETGGDDTTAHVGDVTTAPAGPATKPVTEETTQIVDIVSYDYETVTLDEVLAEVGAQKSRKILRYPKMTGLSNPDMQTKINELLADIAASEFKNRLLGLDEYTKSGVTVKYEIKSSTVTYLGGNLLAVRSEGELSYSDDTANVNFVYANVINLSTGRNISQKKLYSDFGKLRELFEAGRFKQISGTKNITSSISLQDMMTQYSMYELYNTYPDTYFTPTELVIVIELTSNLGGFAEFSLPLATANAYLSMSPTK